MAQFETGNHSAGNECMTYPPIKSAFRFWWRYLLAHQFVES